MALGQAHAIRPLVVERRNDDVPPREEGLACIKGGGTVLAICCSNEQQSGRSTIEHLAMQVRVLNTVYMYSKWVNPESP